MKFHVLASVNVSTTYTAVDMSHRKVDRILRKVVGLPVYLLIYPPLYFSTYLSKYIVSQNIKPKFYLDCGLLSY